MQFTNILAVVVLLAGSTFAAPAPEANKPAKPVQPTTVTVESNRCGNGVGAYCCNSDNFGAFTTCKVIAGSQCDATTVCCNADKSIQVCLGNAKIL